MRIAIVEDEDVCAELLISYIRRYEQEKSCAFEVVRFKDGMNFVSDYKSDFDVVFMDIEMPHLDGMSASRKLRELDENVCLIFVTNMAKYALKGYEVSALDFMIKPVKYFNFMMKLTRAIETRNKNKRAEINLPLKDNATRLSVADILYVEVRNHMLIYHTYKGVVSVRGTMGSLEQSLQDRNFARCGNSYLINLAKVSTVQKNMVVIGETEIPISRSYKTEFMRALAAYVGGD